MSGTCIDYNCLGSGKASVDNLESSLNSLKASAGDVRSFPPEYPGMLMTAVSEVADAVDSISTAEIQTLQQKVSETVKLATNPALGFGYNEQVAFEQGYNSYNNVYNDIKNGGNAYDIQRLYDYNQEISTKNALEYYSKKNIQGTLTEKEKEAYTQLQKEYKWATKNSYNDNYNRELAAAQARMAQTDGKSYTQQSEDRKNVYNLKEKMGIQMSDAEREMLQSGAVEIFFEPVETAVASVLEGVLGVVENIGDGALTILGGLASYSPLVKGAETAYNFLFGEDADFTKSIQDGVKNIVSKHVVEDLYDAYVDWSGIPDNVAYGKIHSIAQAVGTMAGYVGLGFIPGGQVVGAVISGFAAAGDAAQTAFDNGATFNQAFISSAVAGVAGAVAGNVLDKSKNVALSAGVAAAEPFVNSVVQYYTYAGDMVDGRGNKQYSGFWDYYGKSGGLTSSVMAGMIGGITAGKKSYRNEVYETNIRTNRNKAIEYYRNNQPSWLSDAEFVEKLKTADSIADVLEKEKVITREKFYEIWGTPKGERPDPATYLPKKYQKKVKKLFEENGASRLVDGDTYRNRVASNGGNVGNPQPYYVGNVKYEKSEFLSTKSSIDNVVNKASKSSDFEASVVEDLGLTPYEYDKYKTSGIKRYDVSSDNFKKLNPRFASGNEPGAFFMDWVPGAQTSGGSYEMIVDGFNLNDNGNKLTTIK